MPELNQVNNNQPDVSGEQLQQATPPTKPKKPTLRKAGNTVIKTTGKITRKIMEIFASMPLPIKIGIILIIVFVILIVVVLESLAAESTNTVTSSVNNVIEKSEDLSSEAKESFDLSGSLLKFPIAKLLEMYDYFANSDETIGGGIRENYNYILGTNEVEIKEGSSSTSSANIDYDKTLNKDSSGRDPKRLEYITGSTANVSTYKVGGSYTWSNNKIGSANVEIVDVEIRVWSSSGATTTKTLQVNKKLENIVKAIFEDIYNDSSHPVIEDVGCFRASDNYPGHPFGVAIDINPDQNPDTQDYPGVYDPSGDSRSMGSDHPIVKIFKEKYGWDWRR